MRHFRMVLLALAVGASAPFAAWAEEAPAATATESLSVGYTLLMYVPNRLLDILDVVRLRVRVGPGMAVGVQATKAASVFAGTYTTVYVGLPGPRNGHLPKLPAGLESRTGLQASVADATLSAGMGPGYGSAEIGLGAQLGLVGFDVGFEPLELLDLVAGFLFIDFQNDDF